MEWEELTCSKQSVWCAVQKIVYGDSVNLFKLNFLYVFFVCVCKIEIVLRISLSTLSYNISNVSSINSKYNSTTIV